MRVLSAAVAAFFLSAGIPAADVGGADEIRLLVLPFDSAGASVETSLHRDAVPAMIEACFSRKEGIAIVDRSSLESILEEQALALTGLTGEAKEVQTGRLAGATVLIGGDLNAEAGALVLSGRAVDVESGSVISSATVQGDRSDIFRLAVLFCSSLSEELEKTALPAFIGPVDAAPEEGLHFMRGLGYFHASRHEMALAEFFRAAGSENWSISSRFWIAKTYDALGKPANTCLELQSLDFDDLLPSVAEDAMRLLASCRERISREESELLELVVTTK